MSNIFEKVLVPSVKTLFTVSVNTKMRKIFKEEEYIEILKIHGLIENTELL